MKHKILNIALALCMLLTLQIGVLSSAHAKDANDLPNGTYRVPTLLMNSTNITNPSMAAGSLATSGTLEVVEGKWYLVATFKTLDLGGVGTTYGNASAIQYFEGTDVGQLALDAQIVSYRNDAMVNVGNTILTNQTAVETVRIPLAVHSKGVYIRMFVDAMNASTNAYIAIDVEESMNTMLNEVVLKAKAYDASAYDATSYALLQNAILDAQVALTTNADEVELATQLQLLNNAIARLQKLYHLADGIYRVSTDVLKADSDETSMAASAVKRGIVVAKDGKLQVELDMGPVSVFGQTAYVDKVEYEDTSIPGVSTFKEASIIEKDSDGHIGKIAFTLPSNMLRTNVKFYYGGSPRGSSARLALGLDKASILSTSKFQSDGTYHVNIALWNASKDELSMASTTINEMATVIVKDNKAKMYITTKKMVSGTIVAYLQDLKIGDTQILALVEGIDAMGNPTMFSFDLPHEDEMIDVMVNPRIAIMGEADIPARIKVDYASLTKVSDALTKPEAPMVEPTIPTDSTKPVTPDTTQKPTVEHTSTPILNKGTVETSDNTNVVVMIATLLISVLVGGLVLRKKKLW